MVYLHDGTLEGILTGIYTMFYARARFDEGQLLALEHYQSDIFQLTVEIETNEEKANKVAQSIYEHFGPDGFRTVVTAFLSDDNDFGTVLFRFLKRAYKMGPKALEALSDPSIYALYQKYRKVTRETHLLTGLLRFSELKSGIFYAEYEPTYNITGLLADHFKERLGDQLWVIHDKKRQIAAFYDKETYYIRALGAFDTLVYSEKEKAFQTMWQSYTQHIAIKERENLVCQRAHMPKKYWKYLTEKINSQH